MAAATATGAAPLSTRSRVEVLMIGTGEYTTGFGAHNRSDKAAGVVALTMFDLRRRGLVGAMHLAGTNGRKLPDIRAHMRAAIGGAYPASGLDLALTTYPADDAVDPQAYEAALAALPKGSAVTIFTPDDTHFAIALACVKAGMHVLVTKPICKTLAEHAELAAAAHAANVLVVVEVHKRWDPIYVDARDRMRALGELSFFTSYMSQPKMQLNTFRTWAGLSSDISYYLNSHHIDFHEWVADGKSRPVKVFAMGATGVAEKELGRPCEDTITVNAVWESLATKSTAIASYTASWIAPPSDVHSQQRFFSMTQRGEVTVDQAHRGYSVSTDDKGYASSNPLFMKYAPDEGRFVGQQGYGYRSLEAFVAAVAEIQSGATTPRALDRALPTVHTTFLTTAVLEAGRRSLDSGCAVQEIVYDSPTGHTPVDIRLAAAPAR